MKTLIDAVTLKDRLDAAGTAGRRTVVLDVRWALGDPHGDLRPAQGAEPLPDAQATVTPIAEAGGEILLDQPLAPLDLACKRHGLPGQVEIQRTRDIHPVRGNEQPEGRTDPRVHVEDLVPAIPMVEPIPDVEDAAVAELPHPALGQRHDLVEARRVLLEDALAGLELVRRFEGAVVDVGSGGGTPGIPLAASLPEREVTLLEAERRKAEFLERWTAELPNLRVVWGRAEEQPLEQAGVA
ncbi:RsmG family class I SAM-dependent methyltransferase, partial [uncultured Arthrobacter sp.]|uniref:RsmG family class I SAM-dependent methyltransferase n=1 Tax=uncultured Arthrobacter sp. TaxID=114050 RepID=UPI0032170255